MIYRCLVYSHGSVLWSKALELLRSESSCQNGDQQADVGGRQTRKCEKNPVVLDANLQLKFACTSELRTPVFCSLPFFPLVVKTDQHSQQFSIVGCFNQRIGKHFMGHYYN